MIDMFAIVSLVFVLLSLLGQIYSRKKTIFSVLFSCLVIFETIYNFHANSYILIISVISVMALSVEKFKDYGLPGVYLGHLMTNASSSYELLIILPFIELLKNQTSFFTQNNVYRAYLMLTLVLVRFIEVSNFNELYLLVFIAYTYIDHFYIEDSYENAAFSFNKYITFPFLYTQLIVREESYLSYEVAILILSLIFFVELFKLFTISRKSHYVEIIIKFVIVLNISKELSDKDALVLFLLISSIFITRYINESFKNIYEITRKADVFNPFFIISICLLAYNYDPSYTKLMMSVLFIIPSLYFYQNDKKLMSLNLIKGSFFLSYTATFLSSLFLLVAIAVKIYL